MQDINFKIEKITINSVPRIITCKCKKETNTFWVAMIEDNNICYGRMGIRCDDCFSTENEVKIKPWWNNV